MAHPFTKSVSLPLESKHLTYLLFVPLVQLISCLWYSAPVQCPAECPDSPCPFGLIMRDSNSSGQESICILLSHVNCFPSSFLIGLKMNAFISSAAADHILRLSYSVLAKTPHLTKAWKMGLPMSSSWIHFSVTRLMNWGYTRDTSFAIFWSLSKALISTVSPRWNIFYFLH